MKPSSAPAKTSQSRARNAILMNLLGTPGLGSLMARRWFAGSLQLLLAVIGFLLICIWCYKLVTTSFDIADEFGNHAPVKPVWPIGLTGAILFIIAWLWSLVTSVSLWTAAKNERITTLKAPYIRATKLDEASLAAALATLPQWQRNGEIISRLFQFADFPAAMKFVNAVAEAAENSQHHPDIDIRWNKVTLALTTHDAGGLSEKDFALARQCDNLATGPA